MKTYTVDVIHIMTHELIHSRKFTNKREAESYQNRQIPLASRLGAFVTLTERNTNEQSSKH